MAGKASPPWRTAGRACTTRPQTFKETTAVPFTSAVLAAYALLGQLAAGATLPQQAGDTGSDGHRIAVGVESLPNTTMVACPVASTAAEAAGGLIGIAPDGNGTTALTRTCAALIGSRTSAQVAHAIEVSDGGTGPASAPGEATAASASYALSLVNVRPSWTVSGLTGEANGISVFLRQASSDTAAFLANLGVRSGFAATLESYTFSADERGDPIRAVRTQLGVVNSRDGGEFGLLAIAADGDDLTAGIRVADSPKGRWRNALEVIDAKGATVAAVRARDGAIFAGDVAPIQDRGSDLGSPSRRFATTHTQILDLGVSRFADLPPCVDDVGGGVIAFVGDVRFTPVAWNEAVTQGGGSARTFVRCDGKAGVPFSGCCARCLLAHVQLYDHFRPVSANPSGEW